MNVLKAQMDIIKQLHASAGSVAYQRLDDDRTAVTPNRLVVYVFNSDELQLRLTSATKTTELGRFFDEDKEVTPLRATDFYRGAGKLRRLEADGVDVYIDTKHLKAFNANASFWQIGAPAPDAPVLVAEPDPFTDEDEFVGLIMPVKLG